MVLDYDSARARSVCVCLVLDVSRPSSVFLTFAFHCCSGLRWLQATKSIISGTNTQALTAKADLLKEEVDEAMNKVELCKVTHGNALLSLCSFIVTSQKKV